MTPPALILEIISEASKISMGLYERGSTVHQYEDKPFSYQEINNLCEEIISLINKSNEKGKLASGVFFELKKVGQVLYDQLLTNNVKHKLKTTKIDDLLILIDEGLVQIPWELLYDGTQFLCLKFNMGRNVKTRQTLRESGRRTVGFPLKMLILADPTGDLRLAHQEASLIERELDKKRKIANVAKKVTNIDTQYLKRNLRDYDIVHFAGHTDYDSKNPSNSGWRLMDGRFTAQDIVNMGATAPLPAIVFSNSCQSAQTTKWSIDKDFERKIFGLANAFLLAGVRHYIGTFWKIPDDISLHFAREFYSQAMLGKSIGEAIKNARLKIIKDFGEDTIVWGSYILYGDPTATLLLRPAEKFIIPRLKRPLVNKLIIGLIILSIVVIGSMHIYSAIRKLPTKDITLYREFKKTWGMFLQGKNEEVIEICESILEKDSGYLAVYKRLGNVYDRLGKPDKALNCYFDYLLRSEEKDSKKDIANAKINIAWIYHSKGDFDNAYKYYNEGIDFSKQIGDRLSEAKGYRQLGLWYRDKGDDKKAEELFFKASKINESRKSIYNHRYNLACDYHNIALLYSDRDEYELAKDYYLKSKKIFERLGSTEGESYYYTNVGEILCYEKKYDKALKYLFKALEIDSELKSKPGISIDYELIGNLYKEIGNTFDSVNYYASSLKLKKEAGDKVGMADVHYALGTLYIRTGQKAPAIYHLQKSLELYKSMELPEYNDVVEELKNLGFSKSTKEEDERKEIERYIETVEYFARLESLFKKGKLSQVVKYCEEAIEKDREFDMIYSSLGTIYNSFGDFDKALEYHLVAKEILEKKERIADLAQVNYQIAQTYQSKAEHVEAVNYYKEAIKLFENGPDRSYVTLCKFGMAVNLIQLSNFKEAKKQINEIFDIAEELKSEAMFLYGYGGLCLYHLERGEKEQLEKNLKKCIKISNKYLKLSIDSEEQRELNYILSNLFIAAEDKTKAIEHLKKVIEYDESNENKYALYDDYKSIALVYYLDPNLEEAISYSKKALEFAEDIGSDQFVVESLIALAGNYISLRTERTIKFYQNLYKEDNAEQITAFLKTMKEPQFYYLLDDALDLYNRALNIAIKAKYNKKKAKILKSIAYIYEQKGRPEEALNKYMKVTKILEDEQALNKLEKDWLLHSYIEIAGLYIADLKDPDKASDYFERFIAYGKRQNLDLIDLYIKSMEMRCNAALLSLRQNPNNNHYKKTKTLLEKVNSYKTEEIKN